MSKQLSHADLADIVRRAEEEIDDRDQYARFLTDLATLVTEHFGGHVINTADDDMGEWLVGIVDKGDGSVPEGGGIYKDYDKEGELCSRRS